MKILHIIPNLAGGGAERFVVDLVNEQIKSVSVYLCTLYDLVEDANDFFLQELSSDVEIISLGKKKGLDLAIYRGIHQYITEIKPDIVHTHLASINYIIIFRLYCSLFNKKIRFFHTIHSDANFEIKHPMEFVIRRGLYKRNLIQPITISNESQQSFRTLYKQNCDKLIFNGRKSVQPTVNLQNVKEEIEKHKTNSSTKVLLNVGRFVEIKNQSLLANIVDELILEGENIALLFIGEYNTTEGEKIKENIESLKNTKIRLLGSKRNVVDYLRICDAFCLPSKYEGMPISLIEAMSVGCIPICSPVGGMNSMVRNGETGFLAEDNSPIAYKAAVKKFLCLDENKATIIKAAMQRDFLEKYDIQTTAQQYLDLYSDCRSL